MPSWLHRLLRSPFARSVRAQCDVPALGIRAGELVMYDPRDPDVLLHVRVVDLRGAEEITQHRQYQCAGVCASPACRASPSAPVPPLRLLP